MTSQFYIHLSLTVCLFITAGFPMARASADPASPTVPPDAACQGVKDGDTCESTNARSGSPDNPVSKAPTWITELSGGLSTGNAGTRYESEYFGIGLSLRQLWRTDWGRTGRHYIGAMVEAEMLISEEAGHVGALSIAGYRYRPNGYFFLDLVPSYIETKVWSNFKDGEDEYDLTRFLTVRMRAGLVLPIGPAHVGLAVDLLPSNVPSFGLRLVIGLNY